LIFNYLHPSLGAMQVGAWHDGASQLGALQVGAQAVWPHESPQPGSQGTILQTTLGQQIVSFTI
jgi:hypothetical protein